MNEYKYGLKEALNAMEAGCTSSVELTKSCLDRIAAIDNEINAFITIDKDGALQQAEEADKKRKTGGGGALLGIPLSVKDLLCTKGIRTTCGSKILENFIPPYDATVISKLKEAGAVLLGKVGMDEFAMGSTSETCAFGTPQNPYKKGYVAGGSSGGSAASVASLECFGSLGSDTGGSIRQPASLCGLVGLKPTYGRVSRYGVVAFASSLDQVGAFARSVEDCATITEVISGYDPKDSTSVQCEVPSYSNFIEGLNGMTIGVPREYFGEGLNSEVEKVVRQGIEALRNRGAKIVDVSLPHTKYAVAAYYIIAPSEASSNLARYDGVLYGYRSGDERSLLDMYKESRSAGFGDEVKRRILIGTYALSSGYYDAYYKKASQVRTLLVEDFKVAFTQCDAIISPVCPTAAWKMGVGVDDPLSLYLSDVLTIPANMAGITGLSVPGGFSADGLPIGIQLQAGHFQEGKLLNIGWNLQQELSVPKGSLDI